MKYLKLCVLFFIFGILSVACKPPLGQLDSTSGSGPRYPVEISIPDGDSRGLSGDLQVASIVVEAMEGSVLRGTGNLVKVSGVWKGTFNVSVAVPLDFRAQARDSAGLPLWDGSININVAPTGTTQVNIPVLLLPSSVGDKHSSFSRGSPVDVNGVTAGTGWDGATFSKGASFTSGYGGNLQVAVYSASAEKVLLEIYSQATEKDATLDYWMEKGSDNVWRAVVDMSGNTAPVLYGFRVWGPNWPYNAGWTRGNSAIGFLSDVDTNGHRFNPNKVLYDPYTKEMSHDKETPAMATAGENGGMYGTGGSDVVLGYQTYTGLITGNLAINRRNVDTGKWAPKSVALFDATSFGTKPVIDQKDAIIYEAHVRGLTNHSSTASLTTILGGMSGFEGVTANVPSDEKGTYKGAIYMIPYLKALGINTIELLPVQETANDANPSTVSGGNFWGYMTYGYFAPDRRYSYDKSLGGPTKEFKEMVKAFHDAGMEVYLDVVYNHTGEGGIWGGTGNTKEVAELTSFRGFDNTSYYALVPADKSSYWETTGCGNNFDSSQPVVKELIKSSLTYWLTEMGVDGFRFDLAPVLGRDTLGTWNFNSGATLLSDIATLGATNSAEMIAEAWDTGAGGYQVGNFPSGWGEWNGFYRDAVRKFIKGDGNGSGYSFTDVFHGNYNAFNDQGGPQKSVNFVVAHDGFTLADLVSYTVNDEAARNLINPLRTWPFGPSDGGTSNNSSWDFGGDQQLRRQTLRTIWVIQMFSRGVPMVVYGDEFGRTQNGNNNPYNVDSVATWNNYNQINTDIPQGVATGDGGAYHNNLGTDLKADGQNNLFKFAASMMNLRKNEPALRTANYTDAIFSYAKNDETALNGADWSIRIHIDGSSVSGGSDYLLCINTGTASVPFTLPTPDAGTTWVRIIDTSEWADANTVDNVWPATSGWAWSSGTYSVNSWSTVVFKAVAQVASVTLDNGTANYSPATAAPLVSFASATPSVIFKYTTDSTDPLTSGTATTGSSYQIPKVVGTYTLKVAATKTGYVNSSVTTATYTVTEVPAYEKTPVFDGTIGAGTTEYSSDETFSSSSSGYTFYITWDATYLYLGYKGGDISPAADGASKLLITYLGKEGATGTSAGITYGTQGFTLPFQATHVINWQADWANFNNASWSGSAWSWTNPLGLTQGTDLIRDWAGTSVEIRVPRSVLGNPDKINLLVHFINSKSGSEWTYGMVPLTTATDGLDPNPIKYFQFDLLSSLAPGAQVGNIKP